MWAGAPTVWRVGSTTWAVVLTQNGPARLYSLFSHNVEMFLKKKKKKRVLKTRLERGIARDWAILEGRTAGDPIPFLQICSAVSVCMCFQGLNVSA